MSYKTIVNKYNYKYISYEDVDITSGFIVGKYDTNQAFLIIDGDWYIIEKDRMHRNSYNHNALNYIFNCSSEDDEYSKDVRQYDNFFEASQYINDIIGEEYD